MKKNHSINENLLETAEKLEDIKIITKEDKSSSIKKSVSIKKVMQNKESIELIIHKEIFWLQEVIACMTEQMEERELIEDAESFGKTKEEMEEYLQPLTKFRQAVTKELKEILKEYPLLQYYLNNQQIEETKSLEVKTLEVKKLETKSLETDPNLNFMTHFIRKIRPCFEEQKSLEETAKYINLAFISLLSPNEYVSEEKDKIEIHNLMDLLKALEKFPKEDAYKFKLIRLYNESEKLIEELKQFQPQCNHICEKHFPLIQTMYLEFFKELKQMEDIEKLKERLGVLLKSKEKCRCDVYPEIFFLNRISIFSDSEENKISNLYMYMGIGVPILTRLQYENRFNDTRLVLGLKALADPTRLKILYLLSKQSMYIQELSRELKLTPATISHHINLLVESNLIELQLDINKKKIYYKMNNNKLSMLGKQIEELAK